MMTAFAPGKLFIAGEYAVVTPGEPAVLIAVDRGITVRLSPSRGSGTVESDVFTRPLTWSTRDDLRRVLAVGDTRSLAASTLLTVHDYHRAGSTDAATLAGLHTHVTITSELVHASGAKYGLGSSAAVTVALITAFNEHLGLRLSDEERVKLAILAVLQVSPRASGADVATSTLGGWVEYRSPDRAWLLEAQRMRGVSHLVRATWPGFYASRLPAVAGLHVAVGWTGHPASTDTLVSKRDPSAAASERFLAGSRQAVEGIVAALRSGDHDAVLHHVADSQRALAEFDTASGGGIETDLLRRLRRTAERHGAVAKVSGAGGGDCGVALSKSHALLSRMREDWLSEGIIPLDLGIDEVGATVSPVDPEVQA